MICHLPLELILDSLSRIDYAPGCLHALRPVCRDFDKLLRQFEHSLAVQVIRLQFPPGILAKHPGLYDSDTRIGFKTLDELYIRLHTLFRIERNCHSIRRREGKEAAWMRPEWIDLQQIGMHLIYRLYDAGDREDKALIIRSLPPTSLAILLLTLHLCIHQLRADGPNLLVPTSPLLHGMLRFEVELCCQELILQHGPSFLDALLCHCPHAIKLLETEVRNIEARQLPSDGKPSQKTLIAECRCALASTLGTDTEDNRTDMWIVLERIGTLDEVDVVRVIKGEELVTRKRQDSGVGL
ncbi:hypothetical protein M436DRAFT_73658 [Aureobasidium namibiae CBS 147.97]|uniref:F-box domain-containing protein n=1 Tax=Aureobasidium namibiae CBS 147.97 TaxID=1043004 RepID=A0A074WJW0_9PEZI|nr:uncharacterized protein M436DRAFT_73658 [Aureobasidium namibiae CBS 147.97]KEQ71909.1 hypothetical protein M436DRAFT_73658 [Aureobasidium namibiae CBS 147.97]